MPRRRRAPVHACRCQDLCTVAHALPAAACCPLLHLAAGPCRQSGLACCGTAMLPAFSSPSGWLSLRSPLLNVVSQEMPIPEERS